MAHPLFHKIAEQNKLLVEDVEYWTLEAMDTYGGSFVKQLAVLYRYADPINKHILIDTFRSYFDHYVQAGLTDIKIDKEKRGGDTT